MNARLASSIVLLAAAAAVAQDKPAAPAAPAGGAGDKAPAPAAKKERKASPEAEAALAKYASLLHFPTSRYKTLDMGSHCDVPMLGGEVGCKFHLKSTGEIALEIALPEAATQQYPPEQLKGIKDQAANWIGGMFKPFLAPLDALAKQYDLASSVKEGKTLVEMTRFADGAAWEKATLTFNADGLLEKQVGTPNVDPDDPMSAMNAGAEIEMTLEHKKRGDLWTIEAGKIVQPMGESTVKFTYYELKDRAPLPKQLEVTTPMLPEPLVISLHDFVVDGKPVPGTERPPETKPEPAKKAQPDPPKPDAPKPGEPKPGDPKK
jgi:hypothetical protein